MTESFPPRIGTPMAAHVESSSPGGVPNAGAVWRSDIDALEFPLDAHSAFCMVHRRAFRTLLGFDPAAADCLHHFAEHAHAFRSAAAAKIAQKNLPPGTNLHLTSRDIARKLLSLRRAGYGEA
jgi:hypothetical protein